MFELRRPCGNCPWRTDVIPFLSAERAAEIVQSPAFQCHKTVNYSTGNGAPGDRPQQCAGLMILLHRSAQPNQIMQVGQRLGWFDPTALDDDSPIYRDINVAIEAHGGEPATLLPQWMQDQDQSRCEPSLLRALLEGLSRALSDNGWSLARRPPTEAFPAFLLPIAGAGVVRARSMHLFPNLAAHRVDVDIEISRDDGYALVWARELLAELALLGIHPVRSSDLAIDDSTMIRQAQREILNMDRRLPSGPVYVLCETGAEGVEGQVVKGVLIEETGDWDLDSVFFVGNEDGNVIRVEGWAVDVQVL